MLRSKDIRRRFDRVARDFDDAAFVHAVSRDGIVSRLEPVLVDVDTILDLGCATGATGRLVRRRFRHAHVVALDLSHAMLTRARHGKPWFARASFVQANACCLPFGDAAFDLVVANQLLPWIPDPAILFSEVARVLKTGGCFAFATLGPDSLGEIDSAWSAADRLFEAGVPAAAHVNRFADMHDVGDGLVRAGLREPVLDVDRLTVRYETSGKLFDDLTRAGARNALAGRARELTGKSRFRAMTEALENASAEPGLSLQLELVYGHCWGGAPTAGPADVRIDAARIPLRR